MPLVSFRDKMTKLTYIQYQRNSLAR